MKRSGLTLEAKAALIKAIEEGEKQSAAARRLKLNKSTVCTVLRSKDKILAALQNGPQFKKKLKLRAPKHQRVNDAVLKWFDDQRSRNLPVPGPAIQAKAREVASTLAIFDFVASDGWLANFKRSANLVSRKVAGEECDVDVSSAEAWLMDSWPKLRQKYTPETIYNLDETGLFYRALPDSTLSRKGEKCTGGKLSKERLTITFCVNASGTDKQKPQLIGKSAKPRCFKNINMANLPVEYTSNRKAWQTSDTFKKWLKGFDQRMRKKKKKVLLLLDNVGSHKVKLNLEFVEIAFFPPNLTSVLQPLDQGIIKNFKSFYRANLVQNLIRGFDDQKPYVVDVYEAIKLIDTAWKAVQPRTIQNCFIHAKLLNCESKRAPSTVFEDIDAICKEPQGLIEEACQILGWEGSVRDYSEVDVEVSTSGTLTLDDLIVEPADESDDEDYTIERETISSSAALEALEKLRLYFHQTELEEVETDSVFKSIDVSSSVLLKIRQRKAKQAKISDYFQVEPTPDSG